MITQQQSKIETSRLIYIGLFITITLIVILSQNPSPPWGPVKNGLEAEIPLVWSSKDRIPANHDSIRVHEDWRNDCNMYLSWPNRFTSENHPGPQMRWTQVGETHGQNCVKWHETSDGDMWHDNFMCLPKESKFEMKFIVDGNPGDWDIENDCVNVNHANQGQHEGWSDNYFCVRKKVFEFAQDELANPEGSSWGPVTNLESEIRLFWSSQDRIPAHTKNVRVSEGAEPGNDMYLSWPDNVSPENHPGDSFVWTSANSQPHMTCVFWDEPNDPDYWYDNGMCLPQDSPFEMKFLKNQNEIVEASENGWILELDCISVNRPGQREEEGWRDNYFCVRRKR